ncbi:MAG: protein jag [Oscillospiraceae bacterium]|nr:protein jag [Oscillospiraceae bacterium]
MLKSIEVKAKTTEDAISKALSQLGLERDDISVEIVERGKSGFLGIGAVDAVVRVSYEAPDEPEPVSVEEAVEEKAAEPAPVPEKEPESAPAPRQEAPVQEKAPAAKDKKQPDGTQAERTEEFLRGLLERMDVNAEISITPREGGGLNVNLTGQGIGAVIGRRGETLDAIQHLTNYAVNRGSERRGHINVDAENYRAKREESLVRLAEKMAAKAVKYRRNMALEPMNSYERHVIHTALQDFEGVTTSSVGVEPNRRVVVTYVRPEEKEEKTEYQEWC